MNMHDESPKGAESPAPGAQLQGAGEGSAGAPPSNTAPANSKEGEHAQILRAGIYSVYLSYAGQVQFGLIADYKRIPDPAAVTARFHDEFERIVLSVLLGPYLRHSR